MPEPEHRASRQGLTEYLIVLALFAIAAIGAVAIFGDNLRALFGVPVPSADGGAPAAPR